MHFTDQLGRNIELERTPKRVVSLVPSLTELLYDLGLEEEVVGITKFCVHPEGWLKSKTIIGGTKQHRFDRIEELQPDLIIANKEENTKENVQTLESKYPVFVSDIKDIASAIEAIELIGEVLGRTDKAQLLVASLKVGLQQYQQTTAARHTVLYLIWKDPWMSVGGDTFIDKMLWEAGYENVLRDQKRYPKIELEEIEALNPDFIFLSSEPFPFKDKHLKEMKDRFPAIKPVLVDGEMFSWYGSRILKMPDYWGKLARTLDLR